MTQRRAAGSVGFAFGLLSGVVGSVLLLSGCSPEPSLGQIERDVFQRSCSFATCHQSTGTPAGGLSLGASTYDQLVNAKSTLSPGQMRVVPGDPDASFLMEKLTSDKPKFGQRMPPAQALEPEEIEKMRAWILAGAKNN
ncbi:MAG TPA: hypothetical protein PKL17_02415 [Pseudomonadota bacterium]|jgi:hypothetical protein|nr:hypothetical protein [Pseudomonadota bacterium]HNK43608.1 hypothetical protein [Pseudomonadota bacterium]HNN49566.1 hypothetical protein [Pseudomonadota bacterium]